jgi:hypothetical protein
MVGWKKVVKRKLFTTELKRKKINFYCCHSLSGEREREGRNP